MLFANIDDGRGEVIVLNEYSEPWKNIEDLNLKPSHISPAESRTVNLRTKDMMEPKHSQIRCPDSRAHNSRNKMSPYPIMAACVWLFKVLFACVIGRWKVTTSRCKVTTQWRNISYM
jgi:hypothetical protein